MKRFHYLAIQQSGNTYFKDRKFEVSHVEKGKLLNFVRQSEKKNILKRLKDEDKITEKDFDKICPRVTKPGILYGLSKIHKAVVNNCVPKF